MCVCLYGVLMWVYQFYHEKNCEGKVLGEPKSFAVACIIIDLTALITGN